MHKTENLMSLLGGALLGATAMYLLDPDQGRKRREYIKDHAGDYLDSAGNVLHNGWDKVSDHAHDVGQRIAGKAEEYGQQLSDLAHDYGQKLTDHAEAAGASAAGRAKDAGSNFSDTLDDWRSRGRKLWSKYSSKAQDYAADKADYVSGRARDYADTGSAYADNITDYGNHLWNQVRGLGKRLNSRAQDAADDARSRVGEQHSSPVLPVALTAVGCCAMGVGLMYLMDPERGRARRAWLSNTVSGLVRNTGKTFYRTGKDLSNRATGAESHGRSGGPAFSEQLLENVRFEIARVAPNNRHIDVMADVNGSVTLTGAIRPEDADRIIGAVEDVPGVILVINRLNVQSAQPTPDSGVQR
jgi:gas vesicle protein